MNHEIKLGQIKKKPFHGFKLKLLTVPLIC